LSKANRERAGLTVGKGFPSRMEEGSKQLAKIVTRGIILELLQPKWTGGRTDFTDKIPLRLRGSKTTGNGKPSSSRWLLLLSNYYSK